MNTPIYFDHVEVHVNDIAGYCKFLQKLFCGGRYKVISETGTSMFCSPDLINFEIKKRQDDAPKPQSSGFCRPCLRMEHAKEHILGLGLKIDLQVQNPDGPCYFFTDHEGVVWHIKEYLVRDQYINW